MRSVGKQHRPRVLCRLPDRIYLYVAGRKFEAKRTDQPRRVVKPFKVGAVCTSAIFTPGLPPSRAHVVQLRASAGFVK